MLYQQLSFLLTMMMQSFVWLIATYTYDTTFKHRLLSTTDGHVKQSMTYDSFGNVTGTELAQAGENVTTAKIVSSAQYSADGNRLISSTDASGNTTSYSFDTDWSVMTGTPPRYRTPTVWSPIPSTMPTAVSPALW